jgi:hypothetical protein
VNTLPAWAPRGALFASLALAWVNFLGTGRWADQPGSLHGAKEIWYVVALSFATVAAIRYWRSIGRPVDPGSIAPPVFLAAGAGVLAACLLIRLPPARWNQIPFDDDWTPLFTAAANGVALMKRGVVMGWNWPFLGGYPASADVAQSFAAHALLPMALFGDRIGFHVLHAIWIVGLPLFVWWDLRFEDPKAARVAAALACFTTASLSVGLGKSGDVNSLAGAFSAGLAMFGSRAARVGRWWGGPLLAIGLTAALYSHIGFFVYAGIFLALEAVFYRDLRVAIRAVVAGTAAAIASLPVHWESLRYPAYVSLNNVVYAPGAPLDWNVVLHTLYYNVEILALPHRWFNDYRSLINVWSPTILVVAILPGHSRVRFYAWATLLTHALLRLNAGEFGAGFDRIMHLLPMIAAPALAGFLLRLSGSRVLAAALAIVMALYVAVSFKPVPHVRSVREFNPALIDRIAALDGNLVLVEVSPHRDMDSDPVTRTAKAPWNVHFEGLLPDVAGQRFYSQMWDGWTWGIWRGQVVGAGSFAGRAISKTPPDVFTAEMQRWGVKHLLVWTEASRTYLAGAGPYVERWRDGLWSDFELVGADVRSAATTRGTARVTNLDPLGADVELENVQAGDPVVVRTNYYPAWLARAGSQAVTLYSENGQLAFAAPSSGSYVVRLEYPRRHGLSLLAIGALLAGMIALARMRPRPGG